VRPGDDYSRFRLRLTRWGGLFLFFVLVLGLAAVNTGNNSLMLVVALALGAYVVSGIWSRQVLGKVQIRVRPPREIFAGKAVEFPFEAINRSRIFPACGLVIRDEDGTPLAVIDEIAAGGKLRSTLRILFRRRGRQRAGPWRLEVLLPLGFFLKSKEIDGCGELLVYPAIRPGPLRRRESQGKHRGWRKLEGRGREGEVFQLRDFNEADDARQIHWKQSARQDRLIAVDRRRPRNPPLLLSLEPASVDPEDARACRELERRISACTAEILRRLAVSEEVSLMIDAQLIGPISERRRAPELLGALAEIRAGSRSDA